MKRNRNIGAILLIAAGLLLIAAALYELIPALLAYKRADDTYVDHVYFNLIAKLSFKLFHTSLCGVVECLIAEGACNKKCYF